MPKRPTPVGLGASLQRAYSALTEMTEAIKGIQNAVVQQAQELAHGLGSVGIPAPVRKARATTPKKKVVKSPPSPKSGKISAKQLAARAFQGKYLSAVRGLTVAQRVQVKKTKLTKGGDAALEHAAKLKGK